MEKHMLQLLPCSQWNAPGLLAYLTAQSEEGRVLYRSFGGIAVFRPTELGKFQPELVGYSDWNRVPQKELIRISTGFAVHYVEKGQKTVPCAYTRGEWAASIAFAAVYLVAAILLFSRLCVGETQEVYIDWLFHWWPLGLASGVLFLAMLLLGTLPGFLPKLRKVRKPWRNRLRWTVALLAFLMMLGFACAEDATCGDWVMTEPVFSASAEEAGQSTDCVPFATRTFHRDYLPDNDNIYATMHEFHGEAMANWYFNKLLQEVGSETTMQPVKADGESWRIYANEEETVYLVQAGAQVFRVWSEIPLTQEAMLSGICRMK